MALNRQQQPSVIIQSGGNSRSGGGMNLYLILGLVIAIGGVGFFYIHNKNQQAAQDEAAKLQTNIFTKQAALFGKYIGTWYQFADMGAIVDLAKQVTDWKKVLDAYALLNSGDNLQDKLRTTLTDFQYNKFLEALNQKGIPTNKSGKITITAKAAPTGLVVGKSMIALDNSKSNIPLYLSADNYGLGKIDLTIAKGNNNLPKYLFLGMLTANYVNTTQPWSIDIYKIQLSNGKQYFVSSAYVKKDTQLKGLNEFEGLTIREA